MKAKIITFVLISYAIFCFATNNIEAAEERSNSFWYTIRGGMQLTDAQIKFLVAHFDVIMVKGWLGKKAVDKVKNIAKSLNKDFEIIQYTNGMFDLAYKPSDEKAYAHNSKGNRIKETEYAQGWYLMDLCSGEWREYFVEKAKERINQYGIDGIFVDDMGMVSGLSGVKRIDSMPGHFVGNSWRQYTDDEWYQCGYDFLDHVKKKLGDKIVVFNGLYHRPPQYDTTLLEVTDGGMREGFILTGKYDRFLDEAGWRKLLNQIIKDINKYNKRLSAASRMQIANPTVDDRMFCFTSYLLINKPGNVSYSSPKYPDGLYYFPEMDVDIGLPTEEASSIDGYYDTEKRLYIRKYSKGLVAVNPNAESRKITLERPYYLVIPQGGGKIKENGTYDGRLDYKKVSEVTVPAQTGIILLKAPN